MRETKAAADLIPGDVFVADGAEVISFPYGTRSMPGTLVYVNHVDGIHIGRYFANPETPVSVI